MYTSLTGVFVEGVEGGWMGVCEWGRGRQGTIETTWTVASPHL